MKEKLSEIERFNFRNIHPQISLGTASDRYGGWIGQIYSEGRYQITRRSKKIAEKVFLEEVLPVESVSEYFEHFSVLEIDFTFYRPLLDSALKPTPSYYVLRKYKTYLGENDGLILKVPQIISARKLQIGGKYTANPNFLNPQRFVDQFYNPALTLLGRSLKGFIFEQEYHVKNERVPADENVRHLDAFFDNIPADNRYHIELRTGAYLTRSYFQLLEKHGVGQIFSHWTWLPPLSKQFQKSSQRFFNRSGNVIIRLMTPPRKGYGDTYADAFPFDQMVEGMLNPQMVEEAAELMANAVRQGVHANTIINNRSGGNAPMIAQLVAGRFNEKQTGNTHE
ncbi:MAG: DUF72 domain-containing protein [Deltaproteobacteria bacterium]|nr:DUF72 domain-containing protein [Deltaproteobacteria bacterium]